MYVCVFVCVCVCVCLCVYVCVSACWQWKMVALIGSCNGVELSAVEAVTVVGQFVRVAHISTDKG